MSRMNTMASLWSFYILAKVPMRRPPVGESFRGARWLWGAA